MTRNAGEIAVAATNVSKRFFRHPVLHRVSFEVERGSSFVVLGQSGVGKSVLLKILAQLIGPDEGRVRLSTRNVGMLFQRNALFDSLNVQDNLEFPLRERLSLNARERLARIEKLLEWVGLPGTQKLFPDELSGGMQKRLGIARALIVEPDILFYDEPTAGLDPITSRLIADLILRLKAEMRTTIVVVTSDVMRAFQLADRIGLLIKGRQGASLLDAGTSKEARSSTIPAVRQFIEGRTEGPLTAPDDGDADTRNLAPPGIEAGANPTERLDVDYF